MNTSMEITEELEKISFFYREWKLILVLLWDFI